MRRFDFGKYGLKENPVGHHVTWHAKGREHLAVVEGVYRCETRNCAFLKVRYPCGDPAPDVAASAVMVLEGTMRQETEA